MIGVTSDALCGVLVRGQGLAGEGLRVKPAFLAVGEVRSFDRLERLSRYFDSPFELESGFVTVTLGLERRMALCPYLEKYSLAMLASRLSRTVRWSYAQWKKFFVNGRPDVSCIKLRRSERHESTYIWSGMRSTTGVEGVDEEEDEERTLRYCFKR